MRKIYISILCSILTIPFLFADTHEQSISVLEDQILENENLIDTRTQQYQDDKATLERSLNIELARELDDCKKRNVSCTQSFAQRKYDTLFNELQTLYQADIDEWRANIIMFSDQIKAIQQAELDKQQQLLDAKLQPNIITGSSLENS